MRGPFDLADDWGMGVACCLLLRALNPGENEASIEIGTASKSRGAYSNYWQSSVHGPRAMVAQRDTAKLFFSSCPRNGLLFARFPHGVHKRQVDLVKSDVLICYKSCLFFPVFSVSSTLITNP